MDLAIKAICYEFHLSRKNRSRGIRSQATEFRYERERQAQPRIHPWRDRRLVLDFISQ